MNKEAVVRALDAIIEGLDDDEVPVETQASRAWRGVDDLRSSLLKEGPTKGPDNMGHVMQHGLDCGDPDCELHHPSVIEDEPQRLTAMAWQLVGAYKAIDLIAEGLKAGFTIDQATSAAYGESHDDPDF